MGLDQLAGVQVDMTNEHATEVTVRLAEPEHGQVDLPA